MYECWRLKGVNCTVENCPKDKEVFLCCQFCLKKESCDGLCTPYREYLGDTK
jgi:hypothetical protein